MTMAFEKCIQKMLNDISLPNEVVKSYTEDANKIVETIIKRMKDIDGNFKKAFKGCSLAGSYLDNLKIDLPDEFDINIKLKLPFPLKPLSLANLPGFLKIQATVDNEHALAKDILNRQSCIDRFLLQAWFRNILHQVVGNQGISLNIGTRIYSIEYPSSDRGFAVAHTLLASCGRRRKISFDFVPSFEFEPPECPSNLSSKLQANNVNWFAVPRGRKHSDHYAYSFIIAAPHLERAAIKNKQNLKNALRLIKALRDANDMPDLPSYVLKAVFMCELKLQPCDEFWRKPIGELLIVMLEKLIGCFERKQLPSFLDEGDNLMERVNPYELNQYISKLMEILAALKELKALNRNVPVKRLAKLFYSPTTRAFNPSNIGLGPANNGSVSLNMSNSSSSVSSSSSCPAVRVRTSCNAFSPGVNSVGNGNASSLSYSAATSTASDSDNDATQSWTGFLSNLIGNLLVNKPSTAGDANANTAANNAPRNAANATATSSSSTVNGRKDLGAKTANNAASNSINTASTSSSSLSGRTGLGANNFKHAVIWREVEDAYEHLDEATITRMNKQILNMINQVKNNAVKRANP